MRIRETVNIFATEDTAGECVLFGQQDASKNEDVKDNLQRLASGHFNIAAGATETLPLGDVDAPVAIYIKVAGDLDLVFNGGADTFQLRRTTTGSGYAVHYSTTLYTSVSMTNTDLVNAVSGIFVVYGDAI